MSSTTNLALPMIAAAQAQKHVTHNEALSVLDVIAQLMVLDRDLTAPPSSPTDGDRYIVGAPATGDWAGKDGQIAAWQDGAWTFHAPNEGWLVWAADEDALLVWTGSAWSGSLFNALQNLSLLGVNTSADDTNKLAVAATAVLFTHIGAGIQHKLNKKASGDTASFLFQTNWSGRAEIGLTGDDNFHFKVSPDGGVWHDALILLGASGAARFKSFTVAGLPAASTAGAGAIAYVSDETGGAVLAFSDATNWRRVTDRAIVS
jgi:hypothetical protein